MREFYKIEEICDIEEGKFNVLLPEVTKKKVQIIDDVEPKENFVLILFLQAITMVKRDYITYNEDVLKRANVERKRKQRKTKYEKHLERTFAYELYRIWQNLVMLYIGPNLRVDAEIGKKITYGRIDYSKLAKLKGERKIPDLVLHNSQGNTQHHTIICEIKRDEQLGKTKIKDDLIKLCRYMDAKIWDNNPYKFGCFILASIDRDFDDLKRSVLLLKKELKPYYDKINPDHLLIVLYDGDLVRYDTLKIILEI